MASGKFHFSTALLSYVLFQKYLGTDTQMFCQVASGAICVLGGMLPDIDNTSTISELIPPLRLPWMAVHKATNAAWRYCKKHKMKMIAGEFKAVNDQLDHRGLSHSIIWPVVLSLVSAFFALPELLYLAIGMLTHDLTDVIFGGCKLFSPLINDRKKIAKIKSGGRVEWVLNIIVWVVIIWLMVPYETKIKVLEVLG